MNRTEEYPLLYPSLVQDTPRSSFSQDSTNKSTRETALTTFKNMPTRALDDLDKRVVESSKSEILKCEKYAIAILSKDTIGDHPPELRKTVANERVYQVEIASEKDKFKADIFILATINRDILVAGYMYKVTVVKWSNNTFSTKQDNSLKETLKRTIQALLEENKRMDSHG